jgi:hypothetical protein
MDALVRLGEVILQIKIKIKKYLRRWSFGASYRFGECTYKYHGVFLGDIFDVHVSYSVNVSVHRIKIDLVL